MRFFATFTSCVLLAGCSYGDFLKNSKGVEPPSNSELASYVSDTINPDPSCATGTSACLTPGQYILASLAYTDEKCEQFFNLLERFKEHSQFINEVVTAATTAATPFSAHAGVKTGIIAAGLMNQSNNSAKQIYAFSELKLAKALRGQVKGLMASYRARHGLDAVVLSYVGVTPAGTVAGANCPAGLYPIAIPIGEDLKQTAFYCIDVSTKFLSKRSTENLIIARNVATSYASLCSLAQMEEIIASATQETKTVDKSTSPAPGAPARAVTEAK